MSGPRSGRLVAIAVALAAVGVWLALQSHLWTSALRLYEQRLEPVGWSVPASARSQVFTDNDPYYWLSYASTMVEQRAWRIRHTDADNVPDGRAVHWSQAMAWLLVAAGGAVRVVTGAPWPEALERGALAVNPVMHVLLGAVGLILLSRRAGWLPAIAWLAGVVSAGDLAWNFHPMRPDHQSLHVLFATLNALLLGLGGLGWSRRTAVPRTPERLWVALEPPDRATAWRYMALSGVVGGLGLWTGATVQVLVLAASLAAGCYLVLNRSSDPELDFDVRLWRTWARAGALTGLFFYLVEYVGAWPGLRLEINSPLHALSWWCAGEALVALEGARARGGRAAWLRTAAWTAGAALLPLALFAGPPEWHALKDPAMRRLHNFIQEFYTYSNFTQGREALRFFMVYGGWPLLIPAALWFGGPRVSRSYEWGLLWMGFALAVSTGILAWQQVRWLPFFASSLLLLLWVSLAVAARHASSGEPRWRGLAWGMLVLTLVQSGVFMYRQWAELATLPGHPDRVVQELAKPVLMKHLALQLAAADPGGSMRLLCEPDLAAPLYYFGGIRTVTSFYWENTEGLRDATDFFADDPRGDKARAIALRRGLTHVMLPAGDELAHIFQFVRDGRFDAAAARRTLLGRACEGKPPAWWLLDRERTVAGHARYRFGKGFVNRTMTVYALSPLTADREEGHGAP